jgi:hypothetical protein
VDVHWGDNEFLTTSVFPNTIGFDPAVVAIFVTIAYGSLVPAQNKQVEIGSGEGGEGGGPRMQKSTTKRYYER